MPERADAMERAIQARDFTQLAELTMRDSNQMHAVCLDSYPPLFYLNATSHAIMDLVHRWNDVRSAQTG